MPLSFLRRIRLAKRRDLTTLSLIVSILVAALGILTTYIYVHTVTAQHEREYTLAKEQELGDTLLYIENKFASYQQVLLGGATAISIKGADAVSRDDWKLYYETARIQEKFPGIFGLGFAKQIPPEDITGFTERIRAEGYPDFSVWPPEPRDIYTSILYIEPFNTANRRAFGYDMFSEPVRRTAMSYARDHATFGLTAPVVLKQNIDSSGTASKNGLFYFPVYKGGAVPATTDERQAALEGYVYIAFYVKNMMQAREAHLKKTGITYALTDVTNGTRNPIYAYAEGVVTAGDSVKGNITLNSRTWELTMHVPRSVLSATVGPITIFSAGIVASSLLGSLVFLLLITRIRHVRNRHESELQNTRDELLALASHQLRTPASGVKQYIGMLLQGYFGKLSDDQHAIAQKAYVSNDRQLEIIDQLLYVAKADANQLIVQPEMLDIAAITRDVIDVMHEIADQKNIAFKTKIPKELPIVSDERFVRMIIENLISNAIKYSYPGATIVVRLRTAGSFVSLSVKDPGVGIAPEDFTKLFQKFSRIQNALSSKEGGSGLGLYLAKRLAQAHHGDITVSSHEGKGTRFTLRLPRYTKTDHNVIELTG